MLKASVRRLVFSQETLFALILIIVAIGIRILLTAQGWPESNSDEGTFGLEAMHILLHGERPIFMYGQNYMGTLEAYLGAIKFLFFGVSLFSLRLGMLTLFTLFLICLYLLTRLLYTPRLALFSLTLLSLGARDLLIPEIRAVGGAAETLLFGTLVFLLGSWLALSTHNNASPWRGRRLLASAGWGLAAGLGLWSHLLSAPFLFTSGLLLLIFCRRQLLGWGGVALLGGLLLGAVPLIIYNLTSPLSQNSLAVFLELHRADNTAGPLTLALVWKQIAGTTLYTLPLSTGMSSVCDLHDFPLFGPGTARTVPCSLLYGGWGFGYLLLFGSALCLAAWPVWSYWHSLRSQKSTLKDKEQYELILQSARLLLLVSAGLTILSYVSSPIAALKPWNTRYLVGLLIALPAVLWPLWYEGRSRLQRLPNVKQGIHWLILAVFLLGMLLNFRAIPDAQVLNRQEDSLATNLLKHGIHHIYSGYWTCDQLIFQSQEKIICSDVETDLHTGLNRYQPYRLIVTSDPRSSYVFPENSDFSRYFAQKIVNTPAKYHELRFSGYLIYVPQGPAR